MQRCTIHNTACATFVKGAFLELSVNADSSFELKEEQKIAKNCLREGRNVFAVIPAGFGKSFIFQLFSAVRTGEDFGRIASKHCDFSYLPV